MICIFCRQQRKPSREHLWPRWAQALLEDEERTQPVPHSLEPHGRPAKRWEAPPFTATLKDVCRDCNHSWMSQIEVEAKKVAAPLIQGKKDVLLDPDAQWAIARWAYLKILLFERVDTRYRLLPERRYREMYASSQDEPTLPANMSVFLASHQGLRQGQYQHRLLADSKAQKPELFIGTLTIKRLVVQVIEDIAEDGEVKTFQQDFRVGGYETRIWPFSESFRWPPHRGLTDLGLAIFGGPQPGKTPSMHKVILGRALSRRRYLQRSK